MEDTQRRRNNEHWVCFDCRKLFRKPSRWELKLKNPQHECPECKQPMRDMGVYFEPPSRNDVKAWERMRLMAESGYTFHSEGSKALIEMIGNAKRPSARILKAKLEARRIRDLEGQLKTPMKIRKV